MNWIAFNDTYEEFVKLGRNVPGALIEIIKDNKKHHLLIGNVNIHATAREGEKLFDDDTIVFRYQYIWKHV